MKRDVLDRLIYVAVAVLLAVLGEFFVWGNSLGLGFVLFIAVFLVLFVGLSAYFKHIRNKLAFLFLIPIAVLCFDIFRFNNHLVVFFGPLLVLGLIFLFCVLLTVRNSQTYDFALSRVPVLRNVLSALSGLRGVFADIFSPIPFLTKNKNTKMILLGILIAIPVLLIFLGLFMSADALFADWIRHIFDFETDPLFLEKVLRVGFFGLILSSFFYVLMSEKHDLLDKTVAAVKIDNVISTVVLGVVNLLFLSFVFFQIKYLFGGASFVLENGLRFAEYARSGFFELAWVMVFALVLVSVVYWSMSHHGYSKLVNGLQVLLVLQVGVVAVSALRRMELYQDTYGYTVLRLYVEWFIYFALVVLAFVAISVLMRLKFSKFFYAGLIMGIVALVAVFSVNVDYMIAKENVERYVNHEGGWFGNEKALDVSYLSRKLSVDILPVFVDYDKSDFSDPEYVAIINMIELDYEMLDRHETSIFEYNLGRLEAVSVKNKLGEIYGPFCLKERSWDGTCAQ
ncbi:MAG: DUF4173 domain-containing protein [Candidatus Moranbacteria bacterium]|nr:DUF4173 domain-containing protein [Candidatus Moranbacteria bacterium]